MHKYSHQSHVVDVNLILSLMFSVALIACAHDDENPVEPPPLEPSLIDKGLGRIRVSIDVTGDAKVGTDSYFVSLDGKSLNVRVDTGTVVEALAGRHVIDFRYLEDELWCAVIGAESQVFDVPKGGLTNVSFKMKCPPLDGKGTLVLRVEDYTAYCYGGWICDDEARHGPEQTTITLERINGTRITFTTQVAMWKDIEIPVDAGTYRITPIGLPECYKDSSSDASVHAGKIVRRGFTITCY